VKESLLSGGVPAERITQIASGIPVGEVSTRESERTRGAEVVVGTVAAFTPQKAPSVWVDTVRRVAEACPGARFIWAGEGPLLEECRTRIREYGLAGRVDFPGFVEAVDSVWEKIDIFFLPSAFEALGTVFLDAMARGIPVVATRVGGIGEVVRTDREGILTEAGDDAALAAGIERLVADRVLRKDMGEQGKIRAREFDIGKIVDRLEALYQELTTGSAREVAS
jgi:glycosyltransferase involved in cell wall biosynthesis